MRIMGRGMWFLVLALAVMFVSGRLGPWLQPVKAVTAVMVLGYLTYVMAHRQGENAVWRIVLAGLGVLLVLDEANVFGRSLDSFPTNLWPVSILLVYPLAVRRRRRRRRRL